MRLSGSITALATPFSIDGTLDLRAWAQMLEKQIASGTSAVVVAGSTGEAAALTDDEYDTLLVEAVRVVAGRIGVIAGTGLSNTAKTIAQTRRAAELGAQAALVVTPPYVRPTQAGLVAHYRAVAAQGGLPVILYNVPGRTGVDMAPETVAQLVGVEGIVGLKEARGDAERWAALAPLASPGFALLSGDDPTFVEAMRAGAVGVISVASNVVPASMATIAATAGEGAFGEAGARDALLGPLYDFLGCAPNPIPLKALLKAQGLGADLRLPLLPLEAPHTASLAAMLSLVDRVEAEASAARRAA
ncbi:4-hydroxy-tetrahydrodipicolinate synthase [Silanimonas sp.]|uniref:4-hydroxy-tetrahydrodipicolinate synthase n=1 Tax=Silanimonas sp. TaxID=1929290 RepID=UPI0022BC584D|nr:4-hydroxy-tetrahydrodipicolinate synthase [Silanimonas sp.]MCZ8113911.1 4-hydroxy-tetrahydrodipicolinate synthase [Silanimonas sp.]